MKKIWLWVKYIFVSILIWVHEMSEGLAPIEKFVFFLIGVMFVMFIVGLFI